PPSVLLSSGRSGTRARTDSANHPVSREDLGHKLARRQFWRLVLGFCSHFRADESHLCATRSRHGLAPSGSVSLSLIGRSGPSPWVIRLTQEDAPLGAIMAKKQRPSAVELSIAWWNRPAKSWSSRAFRARSTRLEKFSPAM